MLGTTEIIIIGGVVLLLFGSSALPKFFRSLGKAKSEFQKGIQEAEEPEDNEPEQPPARATKKNPSGKKTR